MNATISRSQRSLSSPFSANSDTLTHTDDLGNDAVSGWLADDDDDFLNQLNKTIAEATV